MKSIMQHNFSQIPQVDIPRSVFNRSHGLKTAFNAAKLIPIFVDEVLPGDTFACKATIMCRLSTPIVPIMDNIFVETFWFFVPCRLVWDDWKHFMGEKDNPTDSTEYTIPQVYTGEATSWGEETLGDYMGIPPNVPDLHVNALPFRCYNLIYNEWFKAQQFINNAPVPKDAGDDSMANYSVRRRGKRHDYFTSCLPNPQMGAAGVEIPLGTTAPLIGTGKPFTLYDEVNGYSVMESISAGTGAQLTHELTTLNIGDAPAGTPVPRNSKLLGFSTNPAYEHGVQVDLSSATAATINSLRTAFQIQKMLEKDARSGTRYPEVVLGHFGVRSPDMRVQRPEILGLSSARMSVNPVQQTSESTVDSPQGNLAAYGVMSDVCGFTKSFTEHGYVIGIINVRCDLTYQSGLNRMWSRETRYDFYWPSFAHLGEQEVYNKEIFLQSDPNDEAVFGYQERYAEYRYKPSMITGKMRSNLTDPAESLDVWHLSENFGDLPVLGINFIEDQSDVVLSRVLALGTSQPQIIMDSHFDLKCARPMPVFSVPGLIDHF